MSNSIDYSNMASFAIIVDGEVVDIISFAKNNQTDDTETITPLDQYTAAFSSNPRIVKKPEIYNFPDKGPMVMFEIYVGDELATTIGYREDMANSQAIVAGLSSDPTIISVDPSLGIAGGWTWDGTNFTAPQ